MNLQENILRIKEVMGFVNEQTPLEFLSKQHDEKLKKFAEETESTCKSSKVDFLNFYLFKRSNYSSGFFISINIVIHASVS